MLGIISLLSTSLTFQSYNYTNVEAMPSEEFWTVGNVTELIPVDISTETNTENGKKTKVNDYKIYTNVGSFDPLLENEPEIPQNLKIKEVSNEEIAQYIVQYGDNNPVKVKENLKKVNASIFGHFSSLSYRVRANGKVIEQLKTDPLIRSIVPVHPSYKISADLKNENGEVKLTDDSAKQSLLVLLWDETSINEFIDFAISLQAEIETDNPETSKVITLSISASKIEQLASHKDVVYLEPFRGNATELDEVHTITKVSSAWAGGWTGSGQTIAMADSGVDNSHPAFTNQIISTFSYGNSGATTDLDGHGTMVAGIMAGSGSGSTDNNKKGLAYDSKLVVQAYLGCTSCPSMTKLLTDAWQSAARVSNNSWGRTEDATNRYDILAREVDDYVWNSMEVGTLKSTLVVVKSAGNDGEITSFGSAKNIITVGATNNIKAGNINLIPSWSGRGPTLDERTKPDIVAPGVQIVSTRSSNGTYTPYLGNSFYTVNSGTSFAAPQVSAAAAILRNYYKGTGKVTHPSAALIKAQLLNGATVLPDYTHPGSDQGWGRLNLEGSLSGSWSYSDAREVSQDGVVTFNFNVTSSSRPFRSTLVWIDPPGDPANASTDITINDLDLKLISPSGIEYSSVSWKNTVEQVLVSNPQTGTWRIEVKGFDIPDGSQLFSLVIKN